MKITVKPERAYFTYYAKYKETSLELVKEENRFRLIKQILKNFGLTLIDIRFDEKALSQNWMHFSKLEEATFLDVSLGLEELTAGLSNPKDEKGLTDFYRKIFETVAQIEIDMQRFAAQWHFSTKENARSFLRDLNPECPVGFKEILDGNGVFYTLKSDVKNMTSHITLVNSLVVSGGLFLSVENVFWPMEYDPEKAFSHSKEMHDFIVNQLGLVFEV